MSALRDSEGRLKVGFWRDPDNPQTYDLPDPQDSVDPSWDPAERAAVIGYLRGGRYDDPWAGYSWCRFKCGIPNNRMGSCDVSDGTYVWPQGYAHYLEKHDVKPPAEFLAHIRQRLAAGETSV